jgi:site-specific DNA recombinase
LSRPNQALFERIRHGPDFTPRFQLAFGRETREREKLEKQEKDIRARIDRLLGAIERGVNEESATQRILGLQRDLEDIRLKKLNDFPAVLPDETVIRTILTQAIQSVEISMAVESARLLFQCVLKEIVLTPIADQRSGETMSITLREDGWPEFWRLISIEPVQQDG